MKKSKLLHPDKSHSNATTSAFRAVQEAWEALRARKLTTTDVHDNDSPHLNSGSTSQNHSEFQQQIVLLQSTVNKQAMDLKEAFECQGRQDARIHAQSVKITKLETELDQKVLTISKHLTTIISLQSAARKDGGSNDASRSQVIQLKERIATLDGESMAQCERLIELEKDRDLYKQIKDASITSYEARRKEHQNHCNNLYIKIAEKEKEIARFTEALNSNLDERSIFETTASKLQSQIDDNTDWRKAYDEKRDAYESLKRAYIIFELFLFVITTIT